MPTFNELYRESLKEVFLEEAQQQLAQGGDGLTCADAYAQQGKPDFTLAYLLLTDVPDDVKRDIFAHAYERHALLSEEKAEEFDRKFHRAFPLIKLEAQRDRLAAQQVKQGEPLRRHTDSQTL